VANYSIVVTKDLWSSMLYDQRCYGGVNRFGKTKHLAKRCRLSLKKFDGFVEIFGGKDDLQKFLFYLHHSRSPYQILKKK